MQENKELRMKIATRDITGDMGTSGDKQAEVTSNDEAMPSYDDDKKNRVFGTEIEIQNSNIPMLSQSDSSTVAKIVGGPKKLRMKAKPLMAPEAESSLGRPTSSDVDTTGECAQS